MNVEIRPAEASDEIALQVVRQDALDTLRKVYTPTEAALKRKQNSLALPRIVALDDKMLVGTLEYYIEEGTLNFMALGVKTSHRRKGVARALILHLEALAREKGCVRLACHTVRETGNMEIFSKLGFACPEQLYKSAV